MFASSKMIKGALPAASKDTLHKSKIQRSKKNENIELNNALLQGTCRHLVQKLRDWCRPSEANFFNNLILAHLFADLKNIFLSCNDIDNAIWDTRATTELFIC